MGAGKEAGQSNNQTLETTGLDKIKESPQMEIGALRGGEERTPLLATLEVFC
jgi:hypothetical protein